MFITLLITLFISLCTDPAWFDTMKLAIVPHTEKRGIEMKRLKIYWYNGQCTNIKSRFAYDLLATLGSKKNSILFVAVDDVIIPGYLII